MDAWVGFMFKVRAVAFSSPARLGNRLSLTSLVTTFPAVGLLMLSTDYSLIALLLVRLGAF